ncbi:MAG TPA: hypothetical protein ENH23_07245 [candidate division Zixibacteria bacterium]|nr:hypothetical protein [candidate division Zixibacteria bacterium]
MTDEQTNETNTGGNENNKKTEETKKSEEKKSEENKNLISTTSELDRADQIAERQKRENDRREKLLEREESLEARRRVGGTTEAGQEQSKPKEVSDEEYTRKAMSGELNETKI